MKGWGIDLDEVKRVIGIGDSDLIVFRQKIEEVQITGFDGFTELNRL